MSQDTEVALKYKRVLLRRSQDDVIMTSSSNLTTHHIEGGGSVQNTHTKVDVTGTSVEGAEGGR